MKTKSKTEDNRFTDLIWSKLKKTIGLERPLLLIGLNTVKKVELTSHHTPQILILTFQEEDELVMRFLMKNNTRKYLESIAEGVAESPIVISSITKKGAKTVAKNDFF